jgi:acyl-CoA thioesterase
MVMTSDLLGALEMERIEQHHYRAGRADLGHGVVSGGQLLGQSLVAAAMGHDGKLPKTIHTVFARAATVDAPLDLLVQPIHAGRAFASSSVVVSQAGRTCAQSLVLLTADEPDLIRHADAAGPFIVPSEEPSDGSWQVQVADGIDLSAPDEVGPPDVEVWVRFDGAPDDALLDQALLAFSTDFFLIGTAMRPHAGVGQAQSHRTLSTGVITHTLTFHEPAAARDWTLLEHHSTYAGRGRAYGRANVFRKDGALAASFVQDAMIRPMEAAADGRL